MIKTNKLNLPFLRFEPFKNSLNTSPSETNLQDFSGMKFIFNKNGIALDIYTYIKGEKIASFNETKHKRKGKSTNIILSKANDSDFNNCTDINGNPISGCSGSNDTGSTEGGGGYVVEVTRYYTDLYNRCDLCDNNDGIVFTHTDGHTYIYHHTRYDGSYTRWVWTPSGNNRYVNVFDSRTANGSVGPNFVGETRSFNEDEGLPCPIGFEKIGDNCVKPPTPAPTPCETALLSRDVYNTTNGQQELGQEPIPIKLSGGWELNNTLDTSSMNLTDPDSGFNSAVYQKLVNGVYQYMYVTEGSTFEGVQDWYNNVSQIPGNSKQYEISVQNAIKLNNLVGNKELYFTGHSLDGGLASVNSLATGRTAYTYNAAGLSYETRNLYIRGHNSVIHATVVKGEIVDKMQGKFGIKAEDSDTINYIEEESTYWQDFFNERSPALNTYKAARLHFIDSVIDILECE